MSKETIFKVTGVSMYSCTGKKNTGGKYPSKMYEVSVMPDNIDELPDEIKKLVKEITVKEKDKNSKEKERKIKVCKAKSKYKYPMWDMDNEEITHSVSIPNDCPIECAFKIEHSNDFDCDFLSCIGIKFTEFVPEKFNPFK